LNWWREKKQDRERLRPEVKSNGYCHRTVWPQILREMGWWQRVEALVMRIGTVDGHLMSGIW
jgi:hypothetical protein